MRKYAVVAILVLAALVTPPDVITQVILFVVVYGLYELSIQLVRIVERRRDRPAARGGRAGRRGRRPLTPRRERRSRSSASRTALERMAPGAGGPDPDWSAAAAWLWHAEPDRVEPVPAPARIGLPLLVGIDRARDTLLRNTAQFARGLPANNALLWGARGAGKSSLVKAVHGELEPTGLKLVELQREDLPSVQRLLALLRAAPERFVLFCDDLSFGHDDAAYKSLKAVLDGGIEGRPENVLFYATSNRRHLMPRDMIENTSDRPRSPPARRWRRRSRCPIDSGSGSASTNATRTPTSP